jgi:hypothetical protein
VLPKSLSFSAIGLCLVLFVQITQATPQNDACNLPEALNREIAGKYPGEKLITLSELQEDHRALFMKEHGDACPGLVKVDFYGDGKPTLALVLVSKSGAKDRARLVVAHRIAANWTTTLLDTADSAVPVVWAQPPAEYQDVYGRKKIRATRPVIVFCGYDSWAILYAWANNRVAKIWIAD